MLDLNTVTNKFFPQPLFLIGTYDEDGAPRFSPISWISYTFGPPACLVMSNYLPGKHMTENLLRTKQFTATIVTPELLPIVEWNNKTDWQPTGNDPRKALVYQKAQKVNAPLIAGTAFSYECTILQTVDLGECRTYFARIDALNAADGIAALDFLDLTKIRPVIYSPANYFSIGEHLGTMGDIVKA